MHAKSVLFEVIIPGDVSTIFSQFGRLPRPDLTSSTTIATEGGGALMVNCVPIREQRVSKLTYT